MSKQIFALIAQHYGELSDLFDQLQHISPDTIDNSDQTDVASHVHTADVVGATTATPEPSALELFTGKPQGQPVYTMAAGETFTREQYHAANWTDDMLVSNGKMTVEYPKPPTPVAAPTPPAAGTPTPGGTEVLRDKAGLPWDGRIHSGGRTINEGSGLWKAKKGVSPQLVAQVTSELHAAKPAGGAPFAPVPAAPAPAAPPAAPAAPTPAAAPQAPAAPGSASEAIAAANASIAAAAANPTTFASAMQWLKANNLTPADALAASQQVDPSIEGWGFLARPEYVGLIPTIIEVLKATHGK